MPKFSANLSMLFTDVEFIKRFERAAKAITNIVGYWRFRDKVQG